MTQAITQRIRGTSFKQEYSRSAEVSRFQRMKAAGGGIDQGQQGGWAKAAPRQRQPSMVQGMGEMLVPPKAPGLADRISVILDLDETLIYAREGPLYARPGLDGLLKVVKDQFEGIVWTAGVKAYAQAVVRNINKDDAIHHCVYRHKKWFSGRAGYNKDLTLLGRDMDKTLILENTPDCLRGNEENGVLVADYEGGEYEDNTLPAISMLLLDMKNHVDGQGMTVPQYVRQSIFLRKETIASDAGGAMVCYCLDVNDAELFRAQKAQRVNKDLSADQRKK